MFGRRIGISVSYGRLREACQTDVDGTSIDTLEEVAVQLGLQAEQIMIPADHLFISEAKALPALVVMRLPNGNTHFVVLWRVIGNWVQMMDPATGRRWQSRKAVLDELYSHAMAVPAADWRAWAATAEFLEPLQSRLRKLALPPAAIKQLMQDALATAGWQPIAALDAATRMVTAIVDAGGLQHRQTTGALLTELYQETKSAADDLAAHIPLSYWSVQPLASSIEDDDGDGDYEPMVRLRGAVLVRALAKQSSTKPADADNSATIEAESTHAKEVTLSPELVAAVAETPLHPGVALLRMLAADGIFAPLSLSFALILAALGITLEALLFRGLIGLSEQLLHMAQRYLIFGAILVLLIGNLLIEQLAVSSILRLGRRLEVRLRMAFLQKIPLLGDRYFQSRLMSDMAERSHSIHRLRVLPSLGSGLIRAFFTLLFTTAGLLWLYPQGGWLIIGAATTAFILPLVTQPMLSERDLRVRSHLGALSRFYLDSLLGLVPIRVHHAERAIRREYESMLLEWINAGRRFYRVVVTTEGLQTLVGFGLTIWLLFDYVDNDGPVSAILLLLYWALNMPLIGQEIAQLARQYPAQRNITLRLFEPLTAPQGEDAAVDTQGSPTSISPAMLQEHRPLGVCIHLENVSVRASGHDICFLTLT
ncbi:MAG: cysteine peptidase family C39 domain-containing protein [Caldilineaceae bacterium]